MLKILHLHYFSGAGGKFIANCLSMSGKVAFPNYQIFNNYCQTNDIGLIEQALLNTIPEKAKSRTWWDKEQGCEQLFGKKIFDAIRDQNIDTTGLNSVDSFPNCWLPIVSHDFYTAKQINNYFSKHQVFFLGIEGNPTFTNRAIQLKWPSEDHGLDLNLFRIFDYDFKKLKFDHIIHDWNPLEPKKLLEIENLARLIDVNYSNSMAKKYIEKYVDFHL